MYLKPLRLALYPTNVRENRAEVIRIVATVVLNAPSMSLIHFWFLALGRAIEPDPVR